MDQRPELLQAWESLKDAFVGPSATLSAQLKEEVRRTLAQRTGCRFCASLGQPAASYADRQESLAVAFADAAARDHTVVSDAQVQLEFEEFTPPQIVELLMWISPAPKPFSSYGPSKPTATSTPTGSTTSPEKDTTSTKPATATISSHTTHDDHPPVTPEEPHPPPAERNQGSGLGARTDRWPERVVRLAAGEQGFS
jgi:hypothetical protein